MTYEEIMSITPGSIVPGGCSVNPNATYMGEGEPILNADGSIAAGSHSVSRNDNIVVLDIGYSRQLALIQYPVGNGNYRQGYIINNSNNIQYYNIGTNVWTNGSTSETVYLSYTGSSTLGSLDPYEKAIFLYKVENRYNVVYSTSKGLYTKSGFVDYSGGITAEALEGQVISGGGSSSTNIAPGGIVPGGRTYPANAVIKFDSLYIRDENGNLISGRETSVGDEITVLDISYSKQLALIQYPSGNEIRQGYVTNNTKIINYINPYQWVNGSSTETVYLDSECTKKFGTISAYESATLLYEKGGVYCVAYDSPGNNGGVDMLNKCGFVRFAGNKPQATPSAGELLYQGFPSNVEKISYGTSPAGYPLNIYKIGNGSNVLFANFAIHGFEDDWNHDGTALVYIANKLIRKISATNDLHGWTVYINNCANPDGTFNGISMDGPGRCTVSTRIDMNRCFPYNFTPMSSTRNYTGGTALGAPEAQALHDIVSKINREKINGSNQMVVIDFHGWMGMTQGNPTVGQYFNDKFGYGSTINQYSAGFFSAWAQASLKNTRGLLVEYPKNTRSISQCDNDDYVGKSYRGIMQLLASNSGNSSGGGDTPSTGDQPYNAKGTVINVTTVLNVRKTPSTSAIIVGTLKGGQSVTIVAKNGVWYKISSPVIGYVHSDYIDISKSEDDSYLPSVEVLKGLYEKAKELYPDKGIATWNKKTLDYLRQNKYGNNGVVGVAWNLILKPDEKFYKYVDNDIILKDKAHKYMGNQIIKINNSVIGFPHLAATTLGYIKTNLGIPAFWTGWGGDLATLIGEVIKASESYAESDELLPKLYNYTYNLLGGNSSFGLDNFYDDIDAIYFAKNIGKSPIAELFVNYYTNLVAMRQKLITNSIKKADKTLAESVYDMFTGPNGLGMDFRGVGLFGFIYSKAGTELFESTFSKYPLFVQDVYKVCSYVFAAKIESLQNGYLK